MEKKLFRNEHNKTIAGVAAGLADYMQVDVTIIRVLFVLSTVFLGGVGFIAYIILWIVAPVKNDFTAKFQEFNAFHEKTKSNKDFFDGGDMFTQSSFKENNKWNTPNANGFNSFDDFKPKKADGSGRTIAGAIMLFLGGYFLLRNLDIMPYWFNIGKLYKLWPLAIVAVGVSLIFKNKNKNEWEDFKKAKEEELKNEGEQPVEKIVEDINGAAEDTK